MPAEVETMFYTGEVPWHRIGTRLPNVTTSAEAIEAAGLDWQVRRCLMTTDYGGWTGIPVPHRRAIVRADNHQVIGVVSDQYRLLQNQEAFEFLDGIVGQGAAVYHTAGSLRKGRRVWLLAKLPDTAFVIPGDPVDRYLLIANSHDGSLALHLRFVATRVVCANTLAAAIGERGRGFAIHHKGNLQAKLEQAAQLLGIAQSQFQQAQSWYTRLAQTACTTEQVRSYAEELVPLLPPAQAQAIFMQGKEYKETSELRQARVFTARNTIVALFDTGHGNDLPGARGTWWAAYNAYTEYLTHHRPRTEGTLHSLFFGTNATLLSLALEHALAKT